MDNLFGLPNFRNEIIWKRTFAHSSAKRFGPNFDTILFYTKSGDYTWVPPRQPQDPNYVRTHYPHRDSNGRFRYVSLTGAGTRGGPSGQPWRGFDPAIIGRHWSYKPSTLDRLDSEGSIYWPPNNGQPNLKQYLKLNTSVQAIWTDIPPINSQAKERKDVGGYPTQKPEALLKRIIEASSDPDQVVADFFCGCGTAPAVAQHSGAG